MQPGDLFIFTCNSVFASSFEWFEDYGGEWWAAAQSWTCDVGEPVILLKRIKGRNKYDFFWKLLTPRGIAFCRESQLQPDAINVEA